MVRKALFASLALAPITIALHYAVHPPETVEFVLAAVSLIPLAWLIGEATEHAAEHTGPGIGGFLNATFGNAPELIIALIAVNDGLTDVVRGSLSGSVVGNLLLVLGASLVAGGKGNLDRFSSFLSFGLIAFATLLFLVPSVPGWDGRPGYRRARAGVAGDLDRPPRRLRRGHLVLAAPSHGDARRVRRRDRGLVVPPGARRARGRHGRHRAHRRDPRRLARGVRGQGRPLGVLRRPRSSSRSSGTPPSMAAPSSSLGAGKIALAAEIALASAAQVAVFLIPAVALLSWLIDPLSLSFRPVEIAALAGSVAYTTLVLFRGPVEPDARPASSLGGYAVVVVAFFAAGDR